MNIQLLRLFVPALTLTLGACTTVPKPLQGNFTVVEPSQIAASGRMGDTVRWGGLIIQTQPQHERTCMEILGRELSGSGRPLECDATLGRFIACRASFYDPEVFSHGREVTVIGRVARLSERTVGDYVYVMPEIDAEVIYLWPERRYDPMYAYPYPAPTLAPWPYHRWWLGTYYYRPHPPPRPTPRRADD